MAAMAVAAVGTEMVLTRIAALPLAASNITDMLLLCDTDHDGLGEVIHNPNHNFQIAEYRPVNRYALVVSDTSPIPMPESIVVGYFRPCDVGDVDRDGLTDLVGQAVYDTGGGYAVAPCTFESRDSVSYPVTLVWWTRTPNYFTSLRVSRYARLDGDSLWDIVVPWGDESTAVFENVEDNRESLVCTVPGAHVDALPTIDDFDLNGRTEYTFWNGNVVGEGKFRGRGNSGDAIRNY